MATSVGANCGLSITSKWYFFSAAGVSSVTSTGTLGGPALSFPITAVCRSCVSVPIVPPVVMIFVEDATEESVITTCARESGIPTAPNPKSQWPQARITGMPDVRMDLQRWLVRDGYRVRIYIPYGNDWFPYFIRRLAE